MKYGIKSVQTVKPDGTEIVENLINGVSIKYATTHIDERGSLTEIFSTRWNIVPEPVVHLYTVTVRPGIVKGWSLHTEQTDRMYLYQGILKVVLYDFRKDSPTYKTSNEVFLGEEKKGFLTIPPYVYHAVQNVGYTDGAFINMPTKAFQYDNPDRYRLPPDTDKIPYSFKKISIGK